MSDFWIRDIIVPNKKEIRRGLLCWLAYLMLPAILSSLPWFQEDSLRSSFLYNLTFSIICFLLLLLSFRKFLFRSRPPIGLLLLICLLGFLGTNALNGVWGILLHFLSFLLPEAPNNMNQSVLNEFLYEYKGIMILSVTLFSPFVEELLFRGIIFAPLCQKSPFVAYITSMVIFSAFHVIGFVGEQHWSLLLFSFLEYLPASFVFCWAYQQSRSIWTPIILHGLLNLYSSIAILS